MHKQQENAPPNKEEILFCGDLHGNHQHVIAMAREITPMAVILLGDMEFTEHAHIALEPIADLVWWIAGNHDTDNEESWDNLVNSKLADRCLDGRVVTLADGTRIAGLSGVFREKVWAPPREPVWCSYEQWMKDRHQKHSKETLRHLSTIFPKTIDRLSMDSADILVTHEATELHPHGWEVLSDLADCLGVPGIFMATTTITSPTVLYQNIPPIVMYVGLA